jgi:hypothetical protein
VLFHPDEIQQVKKITNVQLQLLGFKPLACLKDYHNLRPPTFLYPDEEVGTSILVTPIASLLMYDLFVLALFNPHAAKLGKMSLPFLLAFVNVRLYIVEACGRGHDLNKSP